tara:strand:- start:2335 stop:3438 length:1104 start_codon:yes stop_codon:yes gene_type:complete
MDLPQEYRIQLQRQIPNKKTTYSGYKKSEVLSELTKEIINKNIDASLCLSVELHMSGYISEIWKIIFKIVSKNIYTLHPRICVYFEREYRAYKKRILLIKEPYNSQEARNHLVENITVLCVCNKQKPLKLCTITNKEFNEDEISQNICATEEYVQFKVLDPKSIRMPLNEFAFHLYKNDHSHTSRDKCVFWLQWLFTMDKKRMKRKKKDIICAVRPNKLIDPKFYTHYVCLIWEIIRNHPDLKVKSNQKDIIHSLYFLYFTDFKKGSINQKKSYIFFAVLVLINTHPQIDFDNVPLIVDTKSYAIVIKTLLYCNELYTKVHDAAVHQIQEQKNIQHIRKRQKKVKVYSEQELTHFGEFMDNKMYTLS